MILWDPTQQYQNYQFTCMTFFFLFARQPPAGQGLLINEVSTSYTTTHHSRYDSSGRVISSWQRPLPDNTQHSQQTNIHAPGGIRTHDPSRRTTSDLHLRPRGHWDRLYYRGADKSLARPRRKQTRKHVRDVRDFNIETRAVIKFFFPCKARRRRKFTPFWQKH